MLVPRRGLLASTPLLATERLEAEAARVLPRGVADWIAGGAGGEAALARNRAALEAATLTPRVLTGAGPADLRRRIGGIDLPHPIGIAPFGLHGLMHPDAEAATARGAGSALFIVPMVATLPLEAVAAAAPGAPRWMQIYLQADRGATRDLAARAKAAGHGALVVTLSAPVAAWRERDIANRFAPDPARGNGNDRPAYARPLQGGTDPAPTWRDIEALQREGMPIMLKGILHPDDAARAAGMGCGVIVSNHGGRQMESNPASFAALPRVAAAVRGRVPLLMDGGIRRGEDVVKALAAGADAVLVGRPAAWALASGGAEGVRDLLARLAAELSTAMRLLGVERLSAIDRRLLD
ncbi:alpha-hydroxy acid oxidase [Falsiroseomonas ponticola]|uniref:alpha-hydroxy acid oxidase n=1 Tax=Falsiroseomonas ponticola TaxID=2786951 RepID=UPI001931FEF4|nr:alpha-hydroxy acid oxidase [Roseomonas ponticola]